MNAKKTTMTSPSGRLYAGLAAIGVFTHAFDEYKAFLEAHEGHRLFLWNEEDAGQLPADLRDRGESLAQMRLEYGGPTGDEYVRATLVFECARCGDSFVSESADWVKPFKPRTLARRAIRKFRRQTAQPAELNIHEAEPFGILFMDLDDWLGEHDGHRIALKLGRNAVATVGELGERR